MDVRLIAVPYHLGRPRISAGLGPEALLAAGADAAVREVGCTATIDLLDVSAASTNEIAAAFEVSRALASRVRDAVAHGAFPLILAGNCNSSAGTLAGLATDGLGAVWFDAHTDFNTPERTTTGLLEGMALAIATGHAWPAMARALPGFRPIAGNQVVLVGARDLDAEEQRRLDDLGAVVVGPDRVHAAGIEPVLHESFEQMPAGTRQMYLHLDLDVLDPSEGKPHDWALPNGLSLDETVQAIQLLGDRFALRAASIAGYDPACDLDGRVARAAIRILGAQANSARSSLAAAN
ncbi:MAG: arginase family protein [Thermomicrobiales bacterium]